MNTAAHLAQPLTALIDTHHVAGAQAILSDLDGCLVSGTSVLAGARELATRYEARLWVVSNNSEDTAASLARRLEHMGLPITADRVLTAGELLVRTLAAEQPGARLAWFGTSRLAQLASSLGINVTRDAPTVAALTRDPDLTGHDLARLIRLAGERVPIWLANLDPFHPAADGAPVPETGAWWAAVAAAVDVTPARVIGKPSPDLLYAALQRTGVSSRHAVMLGDTEATDGAAARAADIPFLLVERPGSS